jgi:hypothetical protein
VVRGIVLAVVLLLSGNACADVFRHADLHLRAGDEPGSIELTARLPESLRDAGALQWPPGCRQTSARQTDLAGRVLLAVRAQCTQPLERAATITAPWPLDGARLSIDIEGDDHDARLTLRPNGEVLEIPFGVIEADTRGWLALAPEMIRQGVLHIGFGWDHLAFVLCLCMLTRGWRLFGLVTAFTLGHSVSLGLAFFEVLRVPIAPVEALIALSIVFMAREALLARGATAEPAPVARAMLVVVVFGLVHGLGFASALGELGIGHAERWPALVFFNLGVEVGQVLFVMVVTGLFALLRPPRVQFALRGVALHGAGMTGVFWLGQRLVDLA